MGHSYNNGLHTTSKGITIDALRIVGLDSGGTPAIDEDCKSGLVDSVTQAVDGTVVLQLSRPYPPKNVVCLATMSNADGTTDLRFAQPKEDGYDPDAGTMTIYIMNDDDSGAPALAAAGSATAEMHVILMFNRYTN